MTRSIVTGGSGYFGSLLVRRLLELPPGDRAQRAVLREQIVGAKELAEKELAEENERLAKIAEQQEKEEKQTR